MSREILEVNNLVKHFRLDKERYIGAINDVSFMMQRGRTLGLVGESGSGKSTIGRCILGLEAPTAGTVLFEGQPLLNSKGGMDRAQRRRLQLVFQDPAASLNPRRTVRQTIAEPLVLTREFTATAIDREVERILDAVGLEREVLGHHPVSLSPSEQQRVGIARALVVRPDIVVLDEPTSMLDPTVRSDIIDVLQKFQRQHDTSYLFISHDVQAVEQLSHRIAVLYLGRMVEEAGTASIMAEQAHPYTRALLGSVLKPDPSVPLPPPPIRGEIASAINPADRCPFLPRCSIHLPACQGRFPDFVATADGSRVACYAAGGHSIVAEEMAK